MEIADEFAAYLAAKGYDPRSSRHSDFLSEIIIHDLVTNCPLIAERAARGQIVARLRHHQQIGQDDWVICPICARIPEEQRKTAKHG